ncbi:hypothetical protein ABW20_dc0105158 [Dactylellina cionopaga]|nr:hypothetical protein ABW20_dc0105158 [Dactylellina cionopaga]
MASVDIYDAKGVLINNFEGKEYKMCPVKLYPESDDPNSRTQYRWECPGFDSKFSYPLIPTYLGMKYVDFNFGSGSGPGWHGFGLNEDGMERGCQLRDQIELQKDDGKSWPYTRENGEVVYPLKDVTGVKNAQVKRYHCQFNCPPFGQTWARNRRRTFRQSYPRGL